MTWFERLSPLDATFLYLEDDRSAHMHVGAVAVFEGPVPSYARVCALVASRLSWVPRYRQNLQFVPFGAGRPVWVDDADFDLEYHVRHTALPAPGGDGELRALAGRLFAQRLDRAKPLWEMWLIEGLDGGRFAILSKTHHCMIDGVSGVDLATTLMSAAPSDDPPTASEPWSPRPAPSPRDLAVESLGDQVLHPLQLARQAFEPSTEGRRMLLELAAGVGPLLGLATMGKAPQSSLNRSIGPHRRFEMLSIDLSLVKRVRAGLGGTVNDVVLAVVAGAVRKLLLGRGEAPEGELRTMVPVSMRAPGAPSSMGNQVTAIFCPLPIGEPDPRERLRRISSAMKGVKESGQAIGAITLSRLGAFAPPNVVAQASRVAAGMRFINLVVTNVPGPQAPLYLLNCKLVGCYPAVPLAPNQTVGIAVLSYNGQMGIGLLGDADRMRDLPRLADAIRTSLDELVELSGG